MVMPLLPPILTAEIELEGLPAMRKRDVNNALKAAWISVGKHWVTHMMPRHFDTGAEQRYGYPPRSQDHLRRKRRHHASNVGRPLVYSGQFMDEVTNPARQSIRATHKSVTIGMRHHTVHEKVRKDLLRFDSAGTELKKLMSLLAAGWARRLKLSRKRIKIRIRRR
jgi:hypothetical protein